MLKIKKAALTIAVVGFFLLAAGGYSWAGVVIQGKCVSYDKASKVLTLENEADKANVTFDLSKAKIGLLPEPGDVIRVVFIKEGDKNMALKVMNVTKQSLKK
jgi:hypothetical protein